QAHALPAIPRKLPAIPSLDDLASVRMPHTFMELFNLPISMNDWGYAQTVKSVSGITAIGFTPYACCGIPDIPWSPGLLNTCELMVNDRLVAISDDPSEAVTYQWFPHCVQREQTVDGIRFRTTMFLPPEQRAVLQKIELHNVSGQRAGFTFSFDLRAAVTKKTTAWFVNLPGEGDNQQSWDAAHGRLTFAAQHAQAACSQGIHPPADSLVAGNVLQYRLTLSSGEAREFHFVAAIAPDPAQSAALHDQLQQNFATLETQNECRFEQLLHSAFTAGNSDFSGHLPRLQTNSETLWNLYQNGLKNLITARRRSPDSAYGPTLLTLTGHVLPTLSFPWDTALTSLSLALLDPQPLRNLVEIWFQQDMHQHLATDYISGQAVGPWYAVNDMAIVRCAQDYLRVTGDFAWLDKQVGVKSVLDCLLDHATYWKKLVGRNGLADYGGIQNLLEVVSTYIHEVAGMNAGNVSSMRFVAELLDKRGRGQQAAQLRADATALARRINEVLYVQGKGWWRCGQPDGSFHEVRHCYDFIAVLDNMSDDLSADQKREMAHFFWSQLASRKWMRALASGDPDATWNVRPDHSCLGAYAAWPPESAKGLFKTDDPARVAAWLTEVAKAGNQGPIGQAHFVEQVVPPLQGGAYKASEDAPYIEDWCCISGGAFIDMVIESIFGVDPSLHNGIRVAGSKLAAFDADATLEGLHYQGGEYSISAQGARRIS
ncbi:MAG TPA: hypothetical protein VMD92_15445, partial [Acidobacteriaceae bacterium]|nr:hypothetical protein [Acidobacteriaceae bacterium]